MAKQPRMMDVAEIKAPGDAAALPDPDPDLLPPPGGDNRDVERLYFDPEKWDAEVTEQFTPHDDDPVETGRGRIEGQGTAALFLSDFHLADGTAGGDDFLEWHLRPEDRYDGLYTGFYPPGDSRARLVLSVFTFAFKRLASRLGSGAGLDVVLNGDVIDFLTMKGRGGTHASQRHAPLFRGLAALRERATVYWLRGNHDYVVPSGPWRSGEFYVNPLLRTLAEHGDRWDETNWPPGPLNKGSRLVLELASAFEVRASVEDGGQIRYLMSGLDNVRPLSDDAINGFLDRRSRYSDVAAMAALMSRLKFVGSADDSAAYKGALRRRKMKEYRDWLMVQGHTHVPAAEPGVYYNLGTWITTLIAKRGKESQVEAFPFLLVYADPNGKPVEEYYVVRREGPATAPRAILQSPASVNELRAELGYDETGS